MTTTLALIILALGLIATIAMYKIASFKPFAYSLVDGDFIPKHRKTFYAHLFNAAPHLFREVRWGIPKDGELVHGGGRDGAIWPCERDDTMHKCLIVELVD